jgi:hypothetical protein
MEYDSASDIDDDTNIQELVLRGDFSELDRALEAGMSLEILDGVEWHDLMHKFLRLKNWKKKIRNIQLLYLHRCTRQLEVNSNAGIYLMELKCSITSWVFMVKIDRDLLIDRLKPYTPKFDSEAMNLYDQILQICDIEPSLKLKLPARVFKKIAARR